MRRQPRGRRPVLLRVRSNDGSGPAQAGGAAGGRGCETHADRRAGRPAGRSRGAPWRLLAVPVRESPRVGRQRRAGRRDAGRAVRFRSGTARVGRVPPAAIGRARRGTADRRAGGRRAGTAGRNGPVSRSRDRCAAGRHSARRSGRPCRCTGATATAAPAAVREDLRVPQVRGVQDRSGHGDCHRGRRDHRHRGRVGRHPQNEEVRVQEGGGPLRQAVTPRLQDDVAAVHRERQGRRQDAWSSNASEEEQGRRRRAEA